MQITIYGAGYVGLVSGVCLAELGHNVCIADVDSGKIAQLQQGTPPIYEEGLTELLHNNIQMQRLHFTTQLTEAVDFAGIQIIAVGTPPREDGAADLQFVESVAQTIATHMQEFRLVINKSTVPVGTADRVSTIIQDTLKARGVTQSFAVVSNPEFLREGRAINDFMHPDRIIIGTESETAKTIMQQMYAPLTLQNHPLIFMNTRSAELTKYAANAFLATKISFINEMSHIAEKLNADIEQIKEGLGSDSRINSQFLNPGCGFGGSCFPKDIRALKALADTLDLPTDLLQATLSVNQRQQQFLFHTINNYFSGNLTGKTIGLWGLAFKAHTDDIRCASSRVLMEQLWAAGADVQAYDPVAAENIRLLYPEQIANNRLTLCHSKESAAQQAHALAIVTEWPEFIAADLAQVAHLLAEPVLFDGRNLFHPQKVADCGLHYLSIGRAVAEPHLAEVTP